jgi:D-galactarolactone cycloisomerase
LLSAGRLWRDSPRAARDHERDTSPPEWCRSGAGGGQQVAGGYRAVKLRLGDTLKRHIERTLALRSELGPDVALQADANCRYLLDDVRAMLSGWPRRGSAGSRSVPALPGPILARCASLDRPVLPLAAGENLRTRYDFQRLVDGGTASVVQPDLSRYCGITEALRIAALASAAGQPVCTHAAWHLQLGSSAGVCVRSPAG